MPSEHPSRPRNEFRVEPCAPRDVAVLIPAYEPTFELEALIDRLIAAGVPAVLLVDDGSSEGYREMFGRLALHTRVHLLSHRENLGKGEALKTGIRYFLNHLGHYRGLVTADASGQHHHEDVLRLAQALRKSPHLAIFGARTFRYRFTPAPAPQVPLRTRIGNHVAAAFVRAITGVPITDTQTGLRALPTSLLYELVRLPGTRYEYETTVLLHVAQTGHPLAEQPVRTMIESGTPVSHFRPVADSIRVFHALVHAHGRMRRPMTLSTAAAPAAAATLMNRRSTDRLPSQITYSENTHSWN